ncbi:RNA-binding protein [Collichthys lucidus]|uniref:RNA-binding protein n=1 Tax=Collichthys lucidus TaxID=240159 RepID=A0A4U5UAE7_COLLU|nr:RNA-binding protein [Collichthys lucidus]
MTRTAGKHDRESATGGKQRAAGGQGGREVRGRGRLRENECGNIPAESRMDTEGSQSSLSSSTDNSPHDPCKMFIGGLSWQTTQEGLKEYFCKFGEVKECMVMRDPVTKRSRGFGFVTYAEQAGVEKVLAQNRHELDSKTIDPKVAFPRRAQPKLVTRTKKIFVGGLSVNTTIEDVKHYFDQFGKVECKKAQPKEVMTPTGSARGRSRVMPYGMDAFMLGIGMLGYPGFQTTTYTSRSYSGIAPGYTYQFPEFHLERTPLLTSSHPPELAGSTPSRTAGFLGTSSPGPMADLYAAANQDSGVSSYISAASPAPSTGFGHGLGGPLIATAFTNGYH